jgi:fucose permease
MMSLKTQIGSGDSAAPSPIIFYLLCAGFIVNGIVISFIGPLLPVFSAKWGLDDARAGYFLLVQFLASFIGVLLSSRLIASKGFKPAIVLGLTLLGTGFALLSAPTFHLALVASGIYGLGYGFNTPGTNLWVSESYGARRASALNVVNLAWGVGAIVSSPLAKLTIRTSSVKLLFCIVGTICVLTAAILMRMKFAKPPEEADAGETLRASSKNGIGIAALLGVLFFVYVGTEVGTSSWSATHAQRATGWASNSWALTPMFFFAGLLGGRGAAAVILLRLKEVTVAVSGLLLAASAELVFITAHSQATLFGSAFFTGLGLSSLYPIWVAWLSKWFGEQARKVGGVMFALAALGSASMPWLVGVVSNCYGHNLRVGLVVPLAGCAIMLTTIGLLRPSTRG